MYKPGRGLRAAALIPACTLLLLAACTTQPLTANAQGETSNVAAAPIQGETSSTPTAPAQAPTGNVAATPTTGETDGTPTGPVQAPTGDVTIAPIQAPAGSDAATPVKTPSDPSTAASSSLGPFERSLPDGITVELVAVSQSPDDGGQWWRPDGALLSGPLKNFVTPNYGPKSMYGIRHPRSLFFKVTSTQKQEVNEEMCLAAHSHFSTSAFLVTLRPHKRSFFTGTLPFGFPDGAKTASYEFGVASGAWATIAATPMQLTPAMVTIQPPVSDQVIRPPGDIKILVTNTVTLKYTDSTGKAQEISMLPAGQLLSSEDAMRLTAVLDTGEERPLRVEGGSGNTYELTFSSTSWLYAFNNFNLSKVKEFHVQTRPYHWAQFDSIAADPT